MGERAIIKPAFDRVKVVGFTLEKAARTEVAGYDALEFSGWASLEVPDGTDEVVHVGFFDRYMPDFMGNPVMRWMHGRGDVAGKWLAVDPVADRGYLARGQLINFGGEEDKRRIAMVETGSVKSLSVGFSGDFTETYGYSDKETGLWHWTQNGRLFEISPCDLPCCPGASIELAKAWGLSGQPRPQLLVPGMPQSEKGGADVADQTPDAQEPNQEKSEDATTSFAQNVAVEQAEEAIEEQVSDLMDGLFGTLWDTLEAIVLAPGDRGALVTQLGVDLAAEINRRLGTAAVHPAAMEAFAARAAGELMVRKSRALSKGDHAPLPLAPEDALWPAVPSADPRAALWQDPLGKATLTVAADVDGALSVVWRGVAIAAAKVLGAAGGVDMPEADRRAVWAKLGSHYAAYGKALPEWTAGDWPASLKDVTWHENEPDLLEEQQGEEALLRLNGAAQRLGDLSVHFAREGLTPSPTVLGTLAEAALTAAKGAGRVLNAGAMLAASSLALIDAAMNALGDLREAAGKSRFPEAPGADEGEPDQDEACNPDRKPKKGADGCDCCSGQTGSPRVRVSIAPKPKTTARVVVKR